MVNLINKYFDSYTGLSRQYWMKIFQTILVATFSGTIFFISFYFVNTLGISPTNAGILLSFYGLGSIIGGGLGGYLSDVFYPNNVAVLSLYTLAGTFLMLIFFKTFIALSLVLVTFGIGVSTFTTANSISIIQSAPLSKTLKEKSLNILYSASNAGISLSAFLVWIFHAARFQDIFYLGTIALTLIASTTFKKNATLIKKIKVVPNNEAKTNKILFSVLYTLFICTFLIGLLISQRKAVWFIYLNEHFHRLNAGTISSIFALNPLLIIFWQAPLSRILKKFPYLQMIGWGAFLMCLGMIMLYYSETVTCLLFSCVIYTVGEMIFFPTTQLMLFQLCPTFQQGKYAGGLRASYAASLLLGPASGGFLYQYYGAKTLGLINAFMGVFCLLITFSMAKIKAPLLSISNQPTYSER